MFFKLAKALYKQFLPSLLQSSCLCRDRAEETAGLNRRLGRVKAVLVKCERRISTQMGNRNSNTIGKKRVSQGKYHRIIKGILW